MDLNDAHTALDSVRDTDRRMAERMRWPFQRHALFGLGEGLVVMGIGIAGTTGIAAAGAGFALLISLFYQDKQRTGMFVSGMKGRRTRPLLVTILAVLIAAITAVVFLRWDEGTNPLVLLVSAALAAFLTWASIRWEKLYRAELLSGEAR